MAEVGLVASVVQLAAAGLKLSISLYTFAKTVSEADKDIKSIAREVSLTSAVLGELGSILKQDAQHKVASDTAFATADEIVQECSAVFTDLEVTLQKGIQKSSGGKLSGVGKLAIEKLKWPYRQPKIELLQKNLERLKSTLILMLQVLTYAQKLSMEKYTKEPPSRYDWQQIESLIAANNEAVKQLNESKSRLEVSEQRLAVEDAPTNTSERSVQTSYIAETDDCDHNPRGIRVYAATPKIASSEKDDSAIKSQQPCKSTSIHVMSGMEPAALVNRLTLSGLLVEQIQDARSTLVVASPPPGQFASSDYTPSGIDLRADIVRSVVGPMVTRTQEMDARKEVDPLRSSFSNRTRILKRKAVKCLALTPATFLSTEISAYDKSLLRARFIWSFNNIQYPGYVLGVLAMSQTKEVLGDGLQSVSRRPRYGLTFLLQFQQLCMRAPYGMMVSPPVIPIKRVSGLESIGTNMELIREGVRLGGIIERNRRIRYSNSACSSELSSTPIAAEWPPVPASSPCQLLASSVTIDKSTSSGYKLEDPLSIQDRVQGRNWAPIAHDHFPTEGVNIFQKKHERHVANQSDLESTQQQQEQKTEPDIIRDRIAGGWLRPFRRADHQEREESEPEFCGADYEESEALQLEPCGKGSAEDDYLEPEAQREYRCTKPNDTDFETSKMLKSNPTKALGLDSVTNGKTPLYTSNTISSAAQLDTIQKNTPTRDHPETRGSLLLSASLESELGEEHRGSYFSSPLVPPSQRGHKEIDQSSSHESVPVQAATSASAFAALTPDLETGQWVENDILPIVGDVATPGDFSLEDVASDNDTSYVVHNPAQSTKYASHIRPFSGSFSGPFSSRRRCRQRSPFDDTDLPSHVLDLDAALGPLAASEQPVNAVGQLLASWTTIRTPVSR